MAVAVGGATVGSLVAVGTLVGAVVATGGSVAVAAGAVLVGCGVLLGAGVAAGGLAQATSQNNRRKHPHRFMIVSIHSALIFSQQGAI